MKPSEFSARLRQIATAIDNTNAKGVPVSAARVAADLKNVVASISRVASSPEMAEDIANDLRDRGAPREDVAMAIAEILAEEDCAAVSGDVSELDPACAFDEEKIARVVDFFASFGLAITEDDWRRVRRVYAAELAAVAVLASE